MKKYLNSGGTILFKKAIRKNSNGIFTKNGKIINEIFRINF